MPIYISVYIAAVVGYGWALESGVTIAVPLIMQFISKNAPTCLRHRSDPIHAVGYTVIALLNTAQTLLVDLLPGRGSSISGAVGTFICQTSSVLTASP
jgi:hypothetical protein